MLPLMEIPLWNYTTGPFTDLFEKFLGNGYVFFLVPLVVLTIGLYIKTQNIVVPAMFMIASGAILGFTLLAVGVPYAGLIFIIFAALGIVSLFANLIYGG